MVIAQNYVPMRFLLFWQELWYNTIQQSIFGIPRHGHDKNRVAVLQWIYIRER